MGNRHRLSIWTNKPKYTREYESSLADAAGYCNVTVYYGNSTLMLILKALWYRNKAGCMSIEYRGK